MSDHRPAPMESTTAPCAPDSPREAPAAVASAAKQQYPGPDPEPEAWRTHRRFDRYARLVGDSGVEALGRSTVTIFGIGGVGSYAAEALARAGVGRLILVDFDRICVTNVNRQVHALKGTLGKPKVNIMAERLQRINPDAIIEARQAFYSESNAEKMLTPEPDVVIDAIDNVTAKLHLIATCVREKIRLVSSMGAAARVDPTQVRTADIMQTKGCPLARDVRASLKKRYGLGRDNKPIGITAIYSEEPPIAPQPLAYDNGGFACVCPGGTNGLHDCESRNLIQGSSPFVPAAFGLCAASIASGWLQRA